MKRSFCCIYEDVDSSDLKGGHSYIQPVVNPTSRGTSLVFLLSTQFPPPDLILSIPACNSSMVHSLACTVVAGMPLNVRGVRDTELRGGMVKTKSGEVELGTATPNLQSDRCGSESSQREHEKGILMVSEGNNKKCMLWKQKTHARQTPEPPFISTSSRHPTHTRK